MVIVNELDKCADGATSPETVVLDTVNHEALQPSTNAFDVVSKTPPLTSVVSAAVVPLRFWKPEPELVTVYATVSIPVPGYRSPPVGAEVATVQAPAVPTVAFPVPLPVDVK